MIEIIDTSKQIKNCFVEGLFSYEKWEQYMDTIDPELKHLITEDVTRSTKNMEFTFAEKYIPIIQLANEEQERAKSIQAMFLKITESINDTVKTAWEVNLDVTIILYLGLCNGAGWLTSLQNKQMVLLGIEKILELKWDDYDTMQSLIYHELSHAYHSTLCQIDQEFEVDTDTLLWQLYIEGVAMVLEQDLKGDFSHFHQFDFSTLQYLEKNKKQIAEDFYLDMKEAKYTNQRWFGDWVSYHGIGDVGYYLGAIFIRYMLKTYPMVQVMQFKLPQIRSHYNSFLHTL